MENKKEQISAMQLRLKNSNIDLSSAKNFSSNTFWYYTRSSTANFILQSSSFWARAVSVMNDKHEADTYGDDSNFIHALCFCNSDTEKIPMWYLYAGLTGRGASIGLTPSVMIKFLLSIQTVKTPNHEILVQGKDFELEYGWIFYRKPQNNTEIFYRQKRYFITDAPSEFDRNNYFIKDYPWEYEKEFRILIKNKTGKEFEHLEIDFPSNLYQKLKIRFAPEISEEEIRKIISEEEEFKKYTFSKILRSDLQISMNLFDRNKKDIIENIPSFIDTNNADKVCQTIQLNKLCKNK